MQTPQHHLDLQSLTIPERIDLAQRLWESVREDIEAQPLSPEQAWEVDRRIAAIETGHIVCEPLEKALARLTARW